MDRYEVSARVRQRKSYVGKCLTLVGDAKTIGEACDKAFEFITRNKKVATLDEASGDEDGADGGDGGGGDRGAGGSGGGAAWTLPFSNA